MTETRDHLTKLNWRQGSVLTLERHDFLADLVSDPSKISKDIFVIAPYSCAVVSGDFEAEPSVELIRFSPAGANPNLHRARNPRILQIPVVKESDTAHYQTNINERYFLERSNLLSSAPDDRFRLEPKEIDVLSHWLSKRYRRSVLPTEFNRRTQAGSRWAAAAIKKYFKRSPDNLDSLLGIYLSLDPNDEITDPDEPYEVSILILVSEQQAAQPDTDIESLRDGLRERFDKADGVFVADARIESETNITMSEFRGLIRLDDYDHHSLHSNTTSPETESPPPGN